MTENEIRELAEKIYDQAYTGDDKYHRAAKTSEIVDYLTDGEPVTTETVEQLAADWLEYDQEPEAE